MRHQYRQESTRSPPMAPFGQLLPLAYIWI